MDETEEEEEGEESQSKMWYLIRAPTVGLPLPPGLRWDETTGCSILKRQKTFKGKMIKR